MLGSSKTLTRSHHPPSGAAKTTPDSGKRSHQSTRQVARSFWGDLEREKEDAEARKWEEKCQKKSTGPVLSLDDHEDLMKPAAPSRVSQPPNRASGSKTRERSEEDALLLIHQTTNLSLTRQRSRRQKATNGTQTWSWSSWMMMTAPPCLGRSKVWERKPVPLIQVKMKASRHCLNV